MEDGRRRRRRRTSEGLSEEGTGADGTKRLPLHISEEEKALMRKKAHECPVPKPPGIIGRLLGFKGEDSREEQPRPRIVTPKASEVRENDS